MVGRVRPSRVWTRTFAVQSDSPLWGNVTAFAIFVFLFLIDVIIIFFAVVIITSFVDIIIIISFAIVINSIAFATCARVTVYTAAEDVAAVICCNECVVGFVTCSFATGTRICSSGDCGAYRGFS
jgi:hypothetical protein